MHAWKQKKQKGIKESILTITVINCIQKALKMVDHEVSVGYASLINFLNIFQG